jgi:hypothetical protein
MAKNKDKKKAKRAKALKKQANMRRNGTRPQDDGEMILVPLPDIMKDENSNKIVGVSVLTPEQLQAHKERVAELCAQNKARREARNKLFSSWMS